MPELPEVETVMRGLAARLTDRRIVRARAARGDLRRSLPARLAMRLRGRVVTGFRRRGKYILMRLSGEESLLFHLGMSGRIRLTTGDAEPAPHEHLVFEMDDGTRLGFIDPRRFGLVDLLPTAEEESDARLAGLGPEPLDAGFTAAALADVLAGRRTAIKVALMDQRLIAGLGNIYASEALFRAAISPRRTAGTLGARRIARLHGAIRDTLAEAIEAGGSSFSDYVQPDGELGYFQHAWRVYGRERCPTCAGPPLCGGIVRIVQGGRASFYCPLQQR
ncbi:MAG TPA: bifunctional DNA-formamidopyrimidine glycosylase/DNA-(apurinic or apyrimidinic site) lyase [Acetobacteraceae bacterium]|nr:bifunctional DNA-formamidopyrimidine glycosylase/DNA-(apurinic or apyrimidinic site) lyase [Acetobacteraceae bacterium]